MTESLISFFTATIAVYGIITLVFVAIEALHRVFWEMVSNDDGD